MADERGVGQEYTLGGEERSDEYECCESSASVAMANSSTSLHGIAIALGRCCLLLLGERSLNDDLNENVNIQYASMWARHSTPPCWCSIKSMKNDAT